MLDRQAFVVAERLMESFAQIPRQMIPDDAPGAFGGVFTGKILLVAEVTVRKFLCLDIVRRRSAALLRVRRLAGEKDHEKHRGHREKLMLDGAHEGFVAETLDFWGCEIDCPDRAREALNLKTICVDQPYFLAILSDQQVLRVDVSDENVQLVQIFDMGKEGQAQVDQVDTSPGREGFQEHRFDEH